jgi:hypothetical protein
VKVINRLFAGGVIGSAGYIAAVAGLAAFSFETTPLTANMVVLITFFFGFSDAFYSILMEVAYKPIFRHPAEGVLGE